MLSIYVFVHGFQHLSFLRKNYFQESKRFVSLSTQTTLLVHLTTQQETAQV